MTRLTLFRCLISNPGMTLLMTALALKTPIDGRRTIARRTSNARETISSVKVIHAMIHLNAFVTQNISGLDVMLALSKTSDSMPLYLCPYQACIFNAPPAKSRSRRQLLASNQRNATSKFFVSINQISFHVPSITITST